MPTLCNFGSHFWPLDHLQFHTRAVMKLNFFHFILLQSLFVSTGIQAGVFYYYLADNRGTTSIEKGVSFFSASPCFKLIVKMTFY